MLCVSIGRGRHKQMIAEHKHLVEQGASLVELRVDYINRDVNLKRLLADRPCPVVITCRRQSDGGKWVEKEAERQMLLRSAIVEGVEYVDLEEDIAGKVPRYGKTKRIISYHDFQETPADLNSLHSRMADMDADIIKLATVAHDPADTMRMLRLMEESDIPTIGICMGEIGMPTRILANKFGAPFTFCTFHHERTLAPGQLSYRQMKEIYRCDEVKPTTPVWGVVADPIGHSLSPVVHNAAFAAEGRDGVYVPFRVPRDTLENFLINAPTFGVQGLSVTIPHKEKVASIVDAADENVKAIGAANTIVWKDGKMFAYNTDCQAAMESLDASVGEEGYQNKIAMVLGAGGAAKAVAFGLKKRGADVVIASRRHERAVELAETLGCRHCPWENRFDPQITILVNCTPVGMHPNVDETPFEGRFLRPGCIVFDTVYNPEQTLLIKQARQQGCRSITGVDMFVLQAALQYELFTGSKAPREAMRTALKRATAAVHY